MGEAEGKTSMGLEPNVAGLLCYVGWWITGLIFFILEKENKFVRFHAMQSIVVFGGLSIVFFILSLIIRITFNPFTYIAWGIIAPILWVLAVVLMIILMIKAYQGQKFKLPWAGNFAERQVG